MDQNLLGEISGQVCNLIKNHISRRTSTVERYIFIFVMFSWPNKLFHVLYSNIGSELCYHEVIQLLYNIVTIVNTSFCLPPVFSGIQICPLRTICALCCVAALFVWQASPAQSAKRCSGSVNSTEPPTAVNSRWMSVHTSSLVSRQVIHHHL